MGDDIDEGVWGGNGIGCRGALGDKGIEWVGALGDNGSPFRAESGAERTDVVFESRGNLGVGGLIGRSPGRGLDGRPGLSGADIMDFPSELERRCCFVG